MFSLNISSDLRNLPEFTKYFLKVWLIFTVSLINLNNFFPNIPEILNIFRKNPRNFHWSYLKISIILGKIYLNLKNSQNYPIRL